MVNKKLPYQNTTVPIEKTQASIYTLLVKYGARAIMTGHVSAEEAARAGQYQCDHFGIEFTWRPTADATGYRLRIVCPLGESPPAAMRALFYYLKNKFASSEYGIVEFEREWFPFIVDPNSKKTIFDLAKTNDLGSLLGCDSMPLLLGGVEPAREEA